MSNVKMGFEGQIFYGVAGSTGGTQILNARDISYNMDHERGDSTVRGDGLSIPIKTEEVSLRVGSIEFAMIEDTTDTVLEALKVAAAAGTGVALRTKDHSAGKGFDGDVTLTVQKGMPIQGEQTVQFTATPSRGYGRAPQLYV